MTVTLSLLVGIVIGCIFIFCKLPLPAPPHLAGIIGIAGIWIGGMLGEWILTKM